MNIRYPIYEGVYRILTIYQVWGIVSSFILLWVRHNLQIDKRNRLHTFFLLLTQPYRSRVAIKFESEFKFILL